MALAWFVAVVGYLLLLVVLVGGLSGLGRHLSVLTDAVERLDESVKTLWGHVDAARHATQVIPERIINAHNRSRRQEPQR